MFVIQNNKRFYVHIDPVSGEEKKYPVGSYTQRKLAKRPDRKYIEVTEKICKIGIAILSIVTISSALLSILPI